jgi:hypothetical protein
VKLNHAAREQDRMTDAAGLGFGLGTVLPPISAESNPGQGPVKRRDTGFSCAKVSPLASRSAPKLRNLLRANGIPCGIIYALGLAFSKAFGKRVGVTVCLSNAYQTIAGRHKGLAVYRRDLSRQVLFLHARDPLLAVSPPLLE